MQRSGEEGPGGFTGSAGRVSTLPIAVVIGLAAICVLAIPRCGPNPPGYLKENETRFEALVERYRSMALGGELAELDRFSLKGGGRAVVEPGPPVRVLFVHSSFADQNWPTPS